MLSFRTTKFACYLGYITQAVVCGLAPLLFVIFQSDFGISFGKIGFLITLNFVTQIAVDLVSVKIIPKIGYRTGAVAAHVLSALGLAAMGFLPFVMPAYAGLVIAVMLMAVGGGLIEVLISPMMESIPGKSKSADMSLLHSFFCWGQVGVVLITTLFFALFGTRNWAFLPAIFAVIPAVNVFMFIKVPIKTLEDGGEIVPLKKLFGVRLFWVMLLLMLCAGASELSMSQWSSLFAELGLGVSKTMGDLLGPCAFAVLMGLSRVFFGLKGDKINLKKALMFSSGLCIISYLLAVFAPWPLLSLAGCAMCGVSVGLMWPGVFSLASKYIPRGGTAMFAILALAGDLGCSLGPAIVGFVSESVEDKGGFGMGGLISGGAVETGLKSGLLTAVVFPALMFFGVLMLIKLRKNKSGVSNEGFTKINDTKQ